MQITTCMARSVDHVNMGDRKALALDQGRHEAVKGVEIRQAQINVTPEGLEPTTRIPRSVLEDPPAYAIGDSGLPLLVGSILATQPLPGHQSDRRAVEGSHELGDEGRIVLPIPVEGDHDRGAGGMNTRPDSGALTAACLVPNEAQPRTRRPGAQNLLSGIIRRAVIDIDDLEGRQLGAGPLDLLHEGKDIERLVLDGNDDADARA